MYFLPSNGELVEFEDKKTYAGKLRISRLHKCYYLTAYIYAMVLV